KAGLSLPDAIIISARYAVAKRLFSAPSGFIEGRFETVAALAAGAGEIPFNDGEAGTLVNMRKPVRTVDLITLTASRSGNPEEAILSLAAIGLIRFQSPDEILMDASDPDAMVLTLENALRRMEAASHYEVLSVHRDASYEALQDAYHRMARQLHPDRFQSRGFTEETRQKAQKAFAAVNEAYFVLKDSVARKAYDEQRFGNQ
ncbi:MAG: J domain-containing protein, partial [Acidobacteriota bacterium]|nr:J domain-containing protein [Acidobacteriota bacterium]